MTSSDRKQSASDSPGSEKRQAKRYAVELSGVSHQADGSAIACEIQNICLSGAYVIFKQFLGSGGGAIPAVGVKLALECFIPSESATKRVMLPARIVRHYANGAGIAFDGPDPADLSVLKTYLENLAHEHHQSSLPDDKTHASANSANKSPKEILNTCAKFFISQTQTLIQGFLTTANREMLTAADKAGSDADESNFFSSLGILKRQNKSLLESFHKAVIHEINTNTGKRDDNTSKSELSGHAELSIMEDETFENWLAVKNVINHARSTHNILINELELRLSTLYGTKIDTNNNPFDPGNYAHAFDCAIAQQGLDHKINVFCHSVFNTILTESLEKIYLSIIDILKQYGIDPAQPISTTHDTKERSNDSDNGQTTASEESQPTINKAQETTPSNDSENIDTHVDTSSGGQSIYNLVSELQQLKSQMKSHARPGMQDLNTREAIDSSDSISDTGSLRPEFSVDEILTALSALQGEKSSSVGTDDSNIGARMIEVLREQGLNGDAIKQIDPRHSNIMDVTGNLFETLLHDVLVADSVRQWIDQLEIPILKLALKDESVFTDKNHAARQILNKVSQLEGYTNYNANGEKNAIWKKIDSLLERIAEKIDTDPGILNSSLNEVDSLVKIQNKAFTENVQEVINECSSNDSDEGMDPAELLNENPNLKPWEKQALRLRPGVWLNFITSTSGSQRLRLAWISKNHDRYVFVNLKGLKENTLTFEQISQHLHEETIIPLGNDDEPALDRAQQTMLDKLHKQLLFESTHDSLTGLINRREFEHRLDNRLLKMSEKYDQDVLCFMDIASFGVINSTYGYEAGDKLLAEIASLLLRTVNGKGQLARVSNDAYALLLEEQSVTDARNLIQQHILSLKEFEFTWEDKALSISMNTGLVPISDYETGASELLRTAEICCRTARDKGGNHIHIYQRDDESTSIHQSIIHHVLQIENTINNHNIEILSQKITPIQEHENDKPYHSEIIIRAMDDEGNILPTQDFILAAEHHNQITTLDRWVVTSMLGWMQEHRDEMQNIGGFAINLSGKSLNDASFLDFIHNAVTQADIPTEWICFEITETTDINDLSDAAEFIRKIKETGCHFSLDDFGSGLSSYTYLKNLPVDYLKIDGTFVRNMHESPNDYAVVKSICDIGHFMGKKIIAEFVENDEILELLRDIGVDYAQGWGIEKPQPLIKPAA